MLLTKHDVTVTLCWQDTEDSRWVYWYVVLCGVRTQLQSPGLVAYENSTFRYLSLAVSVPFMG